MFSIIIQHLQLSCGYHTVRTKCENRYAWTCPEAGGTRWRLGISLDGQHVQVDSGNPGAWLRTPYAECRALLPAPSWPQTPSPPVLVMVTGTPWTWTPLMLMVCMACAAAASCAAFRLMMLPAGAIFGRGRSFRRMAAECFLLVPLRWEARSAGLLQVAVDVGAAVAGGLSWTRTVCTSPEGVRI